MKSRSHDLPLCLVASHLISALASTKKYSIWQDPIAAERNVVDALAHRGVTLRSDSDVVCCHEMQSIHWYVLHHQLGWNLFALSLSAVG